MTIEFFFYYRTPIMTMQTTLAVVEIDAEA
jgi:hypothetical protein